MPAEMRSVYSSAVDRIGYDAETGDLIVHWIRGKRRQSVYRQVPPNLAHEVMNAASVGTALQLSVQGLYQHEYL